MSAIQVKNVPDDVHEALRARAAEEGKTIGEVILEALRRDLRRQSMREWLDRVREHRPDPPLTREEVAELMDDADEELWGAR